MFLKGTTKNTFLSKLLTGPVRTYSRAAVQTFVNAMNNTASAESQQTLTDHHKDRFVKSQEYSADLLKK